MSKSNKYSPEVRAHALRLALEARKGRPSLWATVELMAPKIGYSTVTLLEWVKKHVVDTGARWHPDGQHSASAPAGRTSRMAGHYPGALSASVDA